MRTVIALLLLLGACATDMATVEQSVCTQEDIDNGTCQDPGGGSPPDTLPQDTGAYQQSVILQYVAAGYQVVASTFIECAIDQTTRLHYCFGDIQFNTFTVRVICWTFPNGQHICETSTQ